ncbi:hypothetical protein [Yoonia sp. SS1-5]|uniref:PilJ/NarX-like methyl-accepting chemotaxis transducer n=1 Tax=Yoonia rhodophyticola TaxID=3137370 RepID=A0AAN0M7T7_9RHOB
MPNKRSIRLSSMAVLAAIGTTFGAASAAEEGAAQSQLIMTSALNSFVHQTVASACMINADVAVQTEMQELADMRNTFNAHLTTLVADGKIAEDDAVFVGWRPFDESISMILAGDRPDAYIKTMKKAQPALEFATLALLDESVNAYGEAEGATTSEILTLDLLERQDILIHKIKLQACEMAAETPSVEAKATLDDLVDLYQVSLTALTNGMPEVGIAAPTDYAANQVLAAASFDWRNMQPVLQSIAENGTATSTELHGLQVRSTTLGNRMAALGDIYLAPAVDDAAPRVASLVGAAD